MRIIRLLLLTLLILAIPAGSFAQFAVSVMIAPPPLPVYVQPMAPGGGYLWTPGYWAYGDEGYFWVPGTWVMAPAVGLLWTPGYWGWGGNAYAWNAGYWGPHVGFYGGVNYGYGYGGVGYQGGYWNHGSFNYNRSVNNVNVTNVHVYNKTVINNTTINHVSYNGGTGGINARPNATEQVAARDRHTSPTTMQTQHVHAASTNQELRASVNHGRPSIAATAKPGEFNRGVVPAKQAGGPYKAAENTNAATHANANKAAANNATATRANENRAATTRSTENKAAANNATAMRANENKAAENRAATTRANESKAAANNPTATRATGTKLPRITRQPTRTRIRLPSREQHSSLLPVRRQLPMRSLRLVPRQHPGPRLIRKALLVRRKKRPEESEASVMVDLHAIRRSICCVRSSKKCYWRGSSPGARAIFLVGDCNRSEVLRSDFPF